MRYANLSFSLIISLFLVYGCASSGPKKSKSGNYKVEIVESEGVAPLTSNVGQDRKNAINDAQKRAVESVMGVYVSAESLVSKAKLVEDNITSQTEGFIEDYKIIKEGKDDNFYRITIKAWVRSEDLSKKISQMDLSPDKYGNPLISFWIDEKVDDKSKNTNIAELALMKAFVDAGFVVSDHKPEEYYKSRSTLMNDSLENLERLKTDIVVLGDAAATFNTDQGLGGLVSYRANLSFKILMTASREIITTKNEVASGVDINKSASSKKALENVAMKASKYLPVEVQEYLKERAFPTLVFHNIKDISQLKRLIRSIKVFPTVQDAWVKNYSGNMAVIAANLKRGTLEEVAKMLEINDNFEVKTLSAGKYNVEVELISEKKP
ncbi:MAG: hypothetical protein JW871_01245 [Endomicrobiales bacterium]|nr:hypothetical protein [Endomicrobiales bacterium]